MPKKKRSRQQQKQRVATPAEPGPALSAEEQSARREEQKRQWAARKRAQERAERSGPPVVWLGVGGAAIAGVVVLGAVLFLGGGGGDGESTPTPVATRDPRVGDGPIAKSVTVDANDQGQAVNTTFSVTTITAKAGDIIEIKMKNIGSVVHNLHVAGEDGVYEDRNIVRTADDWITDPASVEPGDTGTVLVKIDKSGTYPFQCDFHPDQQKGVLVLS